MGRSQWLAFGALRMIELKVAQMIKRHWQGVINATLSNVTNAMFEGINARIQHIKWMACSCRNRERFRHAIYFHLGGLDLYPEPYLATRKTELPGSRIKVPGMPNSWRPEGCPELVLAEIAPSG
ncbi:MAG: transposase [Gammaproteobacteria bacterium]|nr:transposase [Gammaproteobacteria bacterium]